MRAYRSVGGTPPFIRRGEGSRIMDADGNEYIDYVGSWGPLLLGHRHPQTTKIYTKVDIKALRTLALPWPGGVR